MAIMSDNDALTLIHNQVCHGMQVHRFSKGISSISRVNEEKTTFLLF